MHSQTIDLSESVEKERSRALAAARAGFEDILDSIADDSRERSLHRIEAKLLDRLRHLGVLLVALWLAWRLPPGIAGLRQEGCGWYTFAGLSTAVVRTRFGQVRHLQPSYYLSGGRGDAHASPFGRSIGLAAGRMSLGVHLAAAYLAAKMTFSESVEVMGLFDGYAPAKRSVQGIVDQMGPKAHAFLDAMPPPEDDGEIVVVQVDRKGVRMVDPAEHAKRCRPHAKRPRGKSKRQVRRWRRRRKQRDRRKAASRSKNARMCTIGVVYTLRHLPDGTLEGPIHKRVIGTFDTARSLFRRLANEARKRGYGSKQSIFLCDGEKHLWTLQREFLPGATPCLDWYHLCEYIWAAGKAVHREKKTGKLEAWVELRKAELRRGDIDAVMEALEALRPDIGLSGPGTKKRRKHVANAIRYVENNRTRLRYSELPAQDLDIATGAIEGAVKHVVGARIDGSGMRWCRERPEHILGLRCIAVNGDWDAFCETVMEHHDTLTRWTIPRVTPSQTMTPYQAKRKAA